MSYSVQGRDEREQFLADLLRLSQDEDPVSWLEMSHSAFATQLVLSHLLSHFRIMHGSLETLPMLRTINVNKRFHPSPAITIKIESVLLKPEGFLVRASLKFFPQKLSFEFAPPLSSFFWKGFEQVRDNLGYYYLTWVEDLNTGSRQFHSHQEHLTMAFYPSIASGTKELTFSSQPLTIETEMVSPEGYIRQLPDIVSENLFLKVSLS